MDCIDPQATAVRGSLRKYAVAACIQHQVPWQSVVFSYFTLYNKQYQVYLSLFEKGEM